MHIVTFKKHSNTSQARCIISKHKIACEILLFVYIFHVNHSRSILTLLTKRVYRLFICIHASPDWMAIYIFICEHYITHASIYFIVKHKVTLKMRKRRVCARVVYISKFVLSLMQKLNFSQYNSFISCRK